MVLHKCVQCGKIYDNISNYKKHIETHKRELIKEDDKSGEKCDKCGKRYATKQTLKTHQLKGCKYAVNTIIASIGEGKFELKNKIISLENKIDQLMHKMDASQNNVYINNVNMPNSHITVNNLSINSHGNEKPIIESLAKNEMSNILKYGGDTITKVVQFKHYNSNIPANHNLLLNAQKDEIMLVFDGNNFKETDTNEIIDNLIAKSHTDIYNILRLTENELNTNQKRNLQRLIYKIEQNNQPTKEMINEELRKMMFNNKNMILATFRKVISNYTQTVITV